MPWAALFACQHHAASHDSLQHAATCGMALLSIQYATRPLPQPPRLFSQTRLDPTLHNSTCHVQGHPTAQLLSQTPDQTRSPLITQRQRCGLLLAVTKYQATILQSQSPRQKGA